MKSIKSPRSNPIDFYERGVLIVESETYDMEGMLLN
jgi:hypothetical protein